MNIRQFSILALCVLMPVDRAVADDFKDCSRGRSSESRVEACTRVIESAAYAGRQKSTAYRIRGDTRLRAGALDEAVADFSAALRFDPSDAAAYGGRARSQFAKGDFDAAIADFTSAMQLSANSKSLGPLLLGRGHTYVVKEQFDLAIADLDAAISLNPRSASAHNHRGLAYRRKGKLSQAIKDYSAAIELNPVYALAFNNRGYVYEALGRKEEAIADFSRALLLDSSLTGASEGLKRLKAVGVLAGSNAAMIAEGRKIVESTCSFCHAVGRSGDSPLAKAPQFRRFAARHPDLALREPLSRGIAAEHDEMPKFAFTDGEIDRIIAYINSL